jgi:hypothetical protein
LGWDSLALSIEDEAGKTASFFFVDEVACSWVGLRFKRPGKSGRRENQQLNMNSKMNRWAGAIALGVTLLSLQAQPDWTYVPAESFVSAKTVRFEKVVTQAGTYGQEDAVFELYAMGPGDPSTVLFQAFVVWSGQAARMISFNRWGFTLEGDSRDAVSCTYVCDWPAGQAIRFLTQTAIHYRNGSPLETITRVGDQARGQYELEYEAAGRYVDDTPPPWVYAYTYGQKDYTDPVHTANVKREEVWDIYVGKYQNELLYALAAFGWNTEGVGTPPGYRLFQNFSPSGEGWRTVTVKAPTLTITSGQEKRWNLIPTEFKQKTK